MTIIPLVFVGITTVTAGIMNITGIYIPQLSDSVHFVQGLINLVLTGVMMLSVAIIITDALPGWIRAFKQNIEY